MQQKTKTYLGLAAIAVLVGWTLGDPGLATDPASFFGVPSGWGNALQFTLSFVGGLFGGA